MTGDPFAGDTIAALATAPGRSALAIVRIAGPLAAEILASLAPELDEAAADARVQRLTPICHPDSGALIDRALVTWFPRPASFTGDDVVEISSHGGALTPKLILSAVLAAGARLAHPGEFTRRALDNGKLDFTQAEAILDLIDAGSPAAHRAAIHQLEGGLARRVDELRNAVLQIEAYVAYGIDFPDEDEPPVPPQRVLDAARDVLDQIDRLLVTAPEGARLHDGALVVLAGRPNAGKSSLFNALLGIERAIVTDIAGTTRDAVEAPLTLDGFPFRLVDTAGLRKTGDRVEAIGVEVARRYLAGADILLYCLASGENQTPEDEEFLAGIGRDRVVVIRTKSDIGQADSDPKHLAVSALNGEGLDRLRKELVGRAFDRLRDRDADEPVLTRERQVRALRAARQEIALFIDAARDDIPAEFAATHLKQAAQNLVELIGAVTPDDVLGALFSEFCVGK